MPDPIQETFVLNAKTGLNRARAFESAWDGFKCREITGLQTWWGGISRDGEDAFSKAVKKHLGIDAPAPGRFVQCDSPAGNFRIIAAGERQFFMTGDKDFPVALESVAYFTDQSDGWIGVTVEGPRSRAVLEKLVGIDLHPSVFPAGSAARAPFEGMLAVICCEDAEAGRYAILFQRSSARSFVDHLCHAAASACGPVLAGGH